MSDVTKTSVTPASPTPPAKPPDDSPGHFVPGTLLAGRYRIVALLGRGGMGEVYRADDLTLGQTVALKFLPRALTSDADRLARFRNEVRTAREVSHPNVCRVYDIGEADGLQFLSMEFVSGEDLASLLRRIGRLPRDKGIEVARQICAGLHAAHERGVAHRDLKPENVMIDERGDVRLADFGLAGAADRPDKGLAGTPAYMAPELFDGRSTGTRADIYALGLVLYEVFTGRRMFTGQSFAELAQAHRERSPSSVSQIVPDIDRSIDGVIQQCVSKDPDRRPSSALAVAAALPGGDPLAAALARGETPSPALVASAGGEGMIRPSILVASLASVIAGIVVFAWASASTHLLSVAPLPRSPDVLRDRAAAIVRDLGYQTPPVDSASGFMLSNFVMHIIEQAKVGRPWSDAAAGRPSAVLFWYRQSPEPLTATRFWSGGRIRGTDQMQLVPGTISLQLDSTGRLQSFVAVPDLTPPSQTSDEITWQRLFAAAGLDETHFTKVAPNLTPPVFADRRAAWEGVYPENPSVPIRLDAAAAFGRPVYFSLREPWTASRTDTPILRGAVWQVVLFLLIGIAGVALAMRNLRLGRVDLAGATRLAGLLFLLRAIASALTANYPSDASDLLTLVTLLVAEALFLSALVWVGYAALEPHVRRRWPESLISWTRLISGRWKDPRVGRDILIGVTAALVVLLFTEATDHINIRLGLLASRMVTVPGTLEGWRYLIGGLLQNPMPAVLIAFALLLLLLVTASFVRSRKLAMGIVVILFLGPQLVGGGPPTTSIVGAVAVVTAAVVMLSRVGVLPLIVTLICTPAIDHQPLPLTFSAWYAPFGWFAAACVVALACYGFHVALAGRPVFAGSLLDD